MTQKIFENAIKKFNRFTTNENFEYKLTLLRPAQAIQRKGKINFFDTGDQLQEIFKIKPLTDRSYPFHKQNQKVLRINLKLTLGRLKNVCKKVFIKEIRAALALLRFPGFRCETFKVTLMAANFFFHKILLLYLKH